MFFEYIQAEKDNHMDSLSHGTAEMKQVPVIALVGSFKAEEVDALKAHLEDKFSVEEVSWIIYDKSGDFDQEKELEAFQHTVAAVFNSTQGKRFKESGRVRLSVIKKAESEGSQNLYVLVETMKKAFRTYFDSIAIDLYLLLDQRAYDPDEKKKKEANNYHSLVNAGRLVDDGVIYFTYALSNYDDHERLLSDKMAADKIWSSITLMMAMKILVPDNDEYLYQDNDFRERLDNVAFGSGGVGRLCSLGTLKLQRNTGAIQCAAYRELWRQLNRSLEESELKAWGDKLIISEDKIRQFIAVNERKINIAQEFSQDIFDLVIRNRNLPEDNIAMLTCGEIRDRFFGKNLDLFYHLNYEKLDAQKLVADWAATVTQRLELLSQKEFPVMAMVQLLENAEQSLKKYVTTVEGQKKQFEQKWNGMMNSHFPVQNTDGKEKVSKSYRFAVTYLDILNKQSNILLREKILSGMLDKIKTIKKPYDSFGKTVKDAIVELDVRMNEQKEDALKNGLLRLQISNIDVYYAKVVEEVIGERWNDFQKLVAKIKRSLLSGFDNENLFLTVREFFKGVIYTDKRFHRDFLTELRDRLIGYEVSKGYEIKTDTEVCDFLLTTVDEVRFCLLDDRVSSNSEVHRELGLFLSDPVIFRGGTNKDNLLANGIKGDQLKLFCNMDCDTAEVLFIVGNLKAGNIYKWKNYEQSAGVDQAFASFV